MLSNPTVNRVSPRRLEVEVFPNAGGGYGFGVTKRITNPEGYDRTLNMSVREGDVLAPSFRPTRTSTTYAAPTAAVAWQTTDVIPQPVAFASIGVWGNTFARLQNGTVTFENSQAGGPISSLVFHDAGNGTEYLYAGQQLGTLGSGICILRRTQGGTWSIGNGGGGALVEGVYLVSAAGALWRTVNGYQISKCPSGSDPFTLASWGANIAVGTNYGQITALGALGAAPVVFRTDGIYTYNTADNLFENQFPLDPNPNNFPFCRTDGAGGLYSALYDGTIVHITRSGSITVEHPLKGKTPQRDTPRGPITDIAIWSDRIFAAMGPAYRLVQPPNLAFLKTTDNMATFTDYSNQVVDVDYSTVADISSLPGAGGYILIGFDQPILAVHFTMNLGTGGANTSALAFQMSTGAGTWTTISGYDAEIHRVGSGETFGKSGTITLSPTNDIRAWALATYSGKARFWLRISISGGLGVNTTIANISVVVKRPAPALGNTAYPSVADFEASGMLTKLLVGTIKPGGITWDDSYALLSSTIGTKIVVSTLPLPNSPDVSLMYATALAYGSIPLPNILEPSVAEYPSLANDNVFTPAPIYYPSAVNLGGVFRVVYCKISGANLVDGVDGWGISWRWDDRNAWDNDKTGVGAIKSTNAFFAIDDRVGGSVFHSAIQLLDVNNTDPVGPTGLRIVFGMEEVQSDSTMQTEPVRPTVEVA